MFDEITVSEPVTFPLPLLYLRGTFKSSLPTQSNFHLIVCFSSCPVCLFAPFDSHKYKCDDVYIFIVCVSFYTHVCVCVCVYFVHRTRTGTTRTSLASHCARLRSTQSHVPRQGFAWHRSHSEDSANISTVSSKGRRMFALTLQRWDTVDVYAPTYYSVLMQLRI